MTHTLLGDRYYTLYNFGRFWGMRGLDDMDT